MVLENLSKMKKILFYSDCRFFAGCENMIANLLNSRDLNENYEVKFGYRWSKEYEEGLNKRLNSEINSIKFYFPDLSNPEFLNERIPYSIRRVCMIFIRIFFNPLLFLYEIYKFQIVIRDFNPNIIHINSGGFPPSLSTKAIIIASKVLKVKKKILIVNNSPLSYFSLKGLYNLPIDFLLNACTDFFISGSNVTKIQLQKLLTINNEKVISIPNGIEKRNFQKKDKDILEELNLTNFNGKIFSVVALLIPRKGHKVLIDAIIHLFKRYPELKKNKLKIIIEGKGELEKYLIQYVKINNLDDIFVFIKDYKNVFELISISDCVILPSISNEDFPNIVLEAMSLGKTVIASNLAGIPEQIDNKKSGFLFDPGNFEQLSKIIYLIIENKINLDLIGINALNRYNNNFTAKTAVSNYIKFYEN